MMSDEETKALAERARTGDKKAREALVKAYLPIAIRQASRYRALGLLESREMEDVLSDAAYSICLAVDSWDPERGKFKTYVYIATRKALQDYIDGIRRFSGFSGGTHKKGSFYKPVSFTEDFEEYTENEDSASGISGLVSMPFAEERTPDGICEEKEFEQALKTILMRLPERRRTITIRCGNLLGCTENSPKEEAKALAKRYGISVGSIWRIFKENNIWLKREIQRDPMMAGYL